ncbi:MAG: hypothetical protein IKD77_01110 [Bacilli bacterium]|nr:hypothetical protein [Bacilli bacterium]
MELINSGRPNLISSDDKTKKGNNDGKILFLNKSTENIMHFKTSPGFDKISKPINSRQNIIKILQNLFRKHHLKYKNRKDLL